MPENPNTFFNPNICVFAVTDFRGQNKKFGIKLDDRRRHTYVIGKTGMGKTTMLETMMIHDIYAGHGVGIVDPHGDTAEKIINYLPKERLNDVIYFNPSDIEYPIGFNILETVHPDHKHLVVSGLMGVFKKIWPDVWSARMEYILNNTLLALLDTPGTTLLGVNRLLADRTYRKQIIANIKDPIVKAFWIDEFAKYNERYQQEAIAPIQNKVGQFLSSNLIRNIVAQVKSTINIREIIDNGKIFILNLSKGRIGEDNARLLGGMIITKIQLAAMERVNISEPKRRDFFLYVDEFQNFATESFANILSEARKYRLSLIMAHQYVEQLSEEVAAAVFGNVGTLISFRVGSRDAEILAKEFEPEFTEEDLLKLEKFHVYMKLMIDGVASVPFSAKSFISPVKPTDSAEEAIKVTREKFSASRKSIEEFIMRWSGMEMAPELSKGPTGQAYPAGQKGESPKQAPQTPATQYPSRTQDFRTRAQNSARQAQIEKSPDKTSDKPAFEKPHLQNFRENVKIPEKNLENQTAKPPAAPPVFNATISAGIGIGETGVGEPRKKRKRKKKKKPGQIGQFQNVPPISDTQPAPANETDGNEKNKPRTAEISLKDLLPKNDI